MLEGMEADQTNCTLDKVITVQPLFFSPLAPLPILKQYTSNIAQLVGLLFCYEASLSRELQNSSLRVNYNFP